MIYLSFFCLSVYNKSNRVFLRIDVNQNAVPEKWNYPTQVKFKNSFYVYKQVRVAINS